MDRKPETGKYMEPRMSVDTSPEMEKLFFKLLLEKSGEERLLMGFSMYDFSRQIVEQSLRAETPHMSESDLRLRILNAYYRGEISPALQNQFS